MTSTTCNISNDKNISDSSIRFQMSPNKTHCFTLDLQNCVANVTANEIFITTYDYNQFYDPNIKLKPYETKDLAHHNIGKVRFVSCQT